MKVETQQREHEWLQKLVGEWRYESESKMKDEPPAKAHGTERVRTLGGLWVVAEGQGEMPGGGAATTLMTLGFDPQRKRIVGTWVGSMMTHLWVYDGTLDAAQRVLTLDTQGPSMNGERKLVKYRDVMELVDAGQRVMTSHVVRDDGTWQRFMTANYRRTK